MAYRDMEQNLEGGNGYKTDRGIGKLEMVLLIKRESETKRMIISNAAGRDMNTNTRRMTLVKNQYVRID